MKKLISLLKATTKGEMNIFRINIKNNSNSIKKIIFPLILALIIMCSIGVYAYTIAEQLHEINLTYIMLTIFIIFTSIITFVEGIYKSQGILFDAKDNELLFSLPIEKPKILFSRIIKLIEFQYLYNSLFMIPAFVVYIVLEKPGISFYFISILMILLLPIIPTVLASIVGYIIKGISSSVKAKKTMQTILTIAMSIIIFAIVFNINSVLENLIKNATSINDILTKIYYPAGLYMNLIQKFNVIDLIALVMINIIPLIIFLYLSSILYFKIISNSSEKTTVKKTGKILKIREQKPLWALVKKEIKRFLSSPVYIFNTMFGIVLLLVLTVAMAVNTEGVITAILKRESIDIDINIIKTMIPKIYLGIITFIISLTSITSSSISLEGKSFLVTKTLPISTYKIVLSKIISSNIITTFGTLISSIIFIITFRPTIIDIVFIFAIIMIVPTFISIIGILVNLKYPKMNGTSDVEVVKQSMSSGISVMIGMISSIATVMLTFKMSTIININYAITIMIVIYIIAIIILNKILKKYSEKRFKEINI